MGPPPQDPAVVFALYIHFPVFPCSLLFIGALLLGLQRPLKFEKLLAQFQDGNHILPAGRLPEVHFVDFFLTGKNLIVQVPLQLGIQAQVLVRAALIGRLFEHPRAAWRRLKARGANTEVGEVGRYLPRFQTNSAIFAKGRRSEA